MTQDSPVDNAELSWDPSGVPISTRFNDIYFSKASGIEESQYVFIEGNKLVERWQMLEENTVFTIGETGFGSGLNFLLTWQAWQRQPRPAGSRLHFCSVEKYPLSRQDLTKALSFWPQLAHLSEKLLVAYPPQPLAGLYRFELAPNVLLTLILGDAREGLGTLLPALSPGPRVESEKCGFGPQHPSIDAWFLDGFAPAKNPDMWHPELFTLLARLSRPGTTFATFTVAGTVRKGLETAGFAWQKSKGFARKREMLVGSYHQQDRTGEPQQPPEFTWHLVSANASVGRHCLVIGAGMAGCHTASALARRGFHVTLLDKHDAVARETSGNHQGVVYARLSPHGDALSRFNLAALLCANHSYRSRDLYRRCGQQCGVIHLAMNDKQIRYYRALASQFRAEAGFARWLERNEIQAIGGIETTFPGLFLPQAGWLDPVTLCQTLTEHENIELLTRAHVDKLVYEKGDWHAVDRDGTTLATADIVVLANASEAAGFEQTAHLPLKPIRGQVSHLPQTAVQKDLKAVLCGDGYIAPAHQGIHAFGASFTLENRSVEESREDHLENLSRLRTMSADFARLDESMLCGGRVGHRCTTRDYFPVVGPVCDPEAMASDFADLRFKANATIDAPGAAMPGLYCNLGHGSRGLCYTPLCAEILASVISGEFLPISRDLYRHLHPARFLIRDLMRKRR